MAFCGSGCKPGCDGAANGVQWGLMRVSFVIMTYNRRAVLAQTLGRLPDLMAAEGLAATQWEAVVADNGSSDGTGAWLAGVAAEPGSRVVALPLGENLGCGARNVGVERARGEVVVFLDDDSWPRPGAVTAALDRLAREPELAVLGGPVHLPGGGQDAAALPLVPPGCGLVVRRDVFLEVGGFDAGFVYRAEEYELVFRVLAAGHGVARDQAVRFDHDKTPVARQPARIARLDLHNNLVLLDRWFAAPLGDTLREDWLARYTALLAYAGDAVDVAAVVAQSRAYVGQGPRASAPTPLGPGAIEALFCFDAIEQGLGAWAQRGGVRRVVLLGYSKTLWPVWRACDALGLEVVAVADDGPAFAGMHYRGAAVMTLAQARGLDFDGWAVTNRNPAQAPGLVASVAGDGRRVWRLAE